MINKVLNSIQKGTLLKNIKSRLRIVLRINNKNVYAEYTKCCEYARLHKQYGTVIENGVSTQLPQTHSNKIWWCWLQGVEQAPELVKACLNSLKLGMPDREVIIISTENFMNYVELPTYILEKWKRGIIPAAQFTDILRTSLLCKHGGAWIDSTVLFTAKCVPDYINNSELFVYKQIDLNKKDLTPIVLSNWLIFSVTNHPLLLLTLELLYAYWRDYNYLSHYFIYHLFFTMSCRRYPELWRKVPTFNNHAPHILQQELGERFTQERWEQITSFSDFHKLNHRLNFADAEDSFYMHIIKFYTRDV